MTKIRSNCPNRQAVRLVVSGGDVALYDAHLRCRRLRSGATCQRNEWVAIHQLKANKHTERAKNEKKSISFVRCCFSPCHCILTQSSHTFSKSRNWRHWYLFRSKKKKTSWSTRIQLRYIRKTHKSIKLTLVLYRVESPINVFVFFRKVFVDHRFPTLFMQSKPRKNSKQQTNSIFTQTNKKKRKYLVLRFRPIPPMNDDIWSFLIKSWCIYTVIV